MYRHTHKLERVWASQDWWMTNVIIDHDKYIDYGVTNEILFLWT
jgi:hypothetical protein